MHKFYVDVLFRSIFVLTRDPSAFRRSGTGALHQNKVCERITRLGEALQERVTGDAAEPEGLSESEKVFFGGTKNFKKNYLKLLDRKRFV